MRLKQVVTFLILFLGFQCIQASAQQVVATWTDTAGNWSSAANWSTNPVVPNNGGGTTYAVKISAPGSVVAMDVLTTIDRFDLGTPNTLTINSGNTLNLASGTSNNYGTLINYGNLANGNATTPSAAITNYGTLINYGGIGGLEAGPITNYGTFVNSGNLSLELFSSGFSSGGILINSGTIHAGLFAIPMSIGGIAINTGTIDCIDGVLSFSGVVINSGSGLIRSQLQTLMSGTIDNSAMISLFSFTSSTNSGTINNTGTIGLDAILFNGSFTNSGTINNSGALSNGSLDGAAFINSGSLNNSGTVNNSGFFTNSGRVTISSSGLFTTITDYTQAGGSTVVDGTLAVAAPGNSGGTIVNIQGGTLSGTGTINGNVLMAGTMMPGDAPGTLTIIGNYEQTGTGMFKELMSPYAQAFLDVSGNVVLDPGATLDINLLGGFNPLGDTISIMDFSTLSGQFANGSSFLDDGFLWDITYRQHEIDVTAVEAVPEPSSTLLLSLGFIVLGTLVKRKKMAE